MDNFKFTPYKEEHIIKPLTVSQCFNQIVERLPEHVQRAAYDEQSIMFTLVNHFSHVMVEHHNYHIDMINRLK